MDPTSLGTSHQNDPINVFQSPPPTLPPYGYPVQPPNSDLQSGPVTPPSVPKASKRRKLSIYPEEQLEQEEEEFDGLHRNGSSSRKNRPAGTKRACNQCRQQKV